MKTSALWGLILGVVGLAVEMFAGMDPAEAWYAPGAVVVLTAVVGLIKIYVLKLQASRIVNAGAPPNVAERAVLQASFDAWRVFWLG